MSTQNLKYYEEQCINSEVPLECVPLLSNILYIQNTMKIQKQGGILAEPTEITICDELKGNTKGYYVIRNLKIMEISVENSYEGCLLCKRSANRIDKKDGHGKVFNRRCENDGKSDYAQTIYVNKIVLEDENNNRIKLLEFLGEELEGSTKYGAPIEVGNNMDIIMYYRGGEEFTTFDNKDNEVYINIILKKIESVNEPSDAPYEESEPSQEELDKVAQIREAIITCGGKISLKDYEMYVKMTGFTRNTMDGYFVIKKDVVTLEE